MDNSRTINVVHIASGDLWAGAEVQLFTLAKATHSMRDTSITVILLNHGTLETNLLKNGIDVIVLDESKLNGFTILFKLTSILRKIKPDVIHTHRVKENILGSISALVNSIPSVRTTHGAPEHKPAWYHIPKRAILFIDWLCGRYLQKQIIAVSDELAEILIKDFPAEKINVIENGIDLSSFDTSAAQAKPEGKTATDTYRIGIAGRLVPVKRVDIFIKTAADLFNKHPELRLSFSIYGDGPLHAELTALSRQLIAKNGVRFEGHCENMQRELAALDMLLITSDHEGLPMILLEAMALQTPVIAHATGGIPAVLNNGECGILVSDHRPSSYASAILELIRKPEIRTKIIQNALRRVTGKYSSHINADAYHDAYRNLLI